MIFFALDQVQVDPAQIREASKAEQTGVDGPQITVTLFDCGRYSNSDLIGSGRVLLKRILSLPTKGKRLSCKLSSETTRKPVIGEDGRFTVVELMIRPTGASLVAPWKPRKKVCSTECCRSFSGRSNIGWPSKAELALSLSLGVRSCRLGEVDATDFAYHSAATGRNSAIR